MKPVYLEFCGINSFSEPAVIDFEGLLAGGIFGIFGDTGSGKSTVLDCIGFALYGNVSRAKTLADIVNVRSERGYVIFEFEIYYNGKRRRYRVEREIRRKKEDYTRSLLLYERENGVLVALASGFSEGNALLSDIIGLEQKDFEKCIALPQGEFAQFVKAPRGERLKLVARLFDLEEYGAALVARANERHARLSADWNVLKARLEPFAEYTQERVALLGKEAESAAASEKETRAALSDAREREGLAARRFADKAELQKVEERLGVLGAQEEEMKALERELHRLHFAAAAVRALREKQEAERALAAAEEGAKSAEEKRALAQEAVRRAGEYDLAKADEEISLLTERSARAEESEKAARRKKTLAEDLERARTEYGQEAAKFRGFSYEEERAALENALAQLGEGDFLTFAGAYARDALFRDEYAVFADELEGIENKYPETEKDISPLVKKYRGRAEGERTDISAVRTQFEAREREKKRLQAAMLELEKKNGLYRAHRERLLQLQSEGKRLKEELGAIVLPEETLSRAQLAEALLSKKRERQRFSEESERAGSALARAESGRAVAAEKVRSCTAALEGAEKRAGDALAQGAFSSAEEAARIFEKFGSDHEAEARVKAFREERAALLARQAELLLRAPGEETEESLTRAREEVAALEEKLGECVRTLALKRDELSRAEEALSKKRGLEEEENALRAKLTLASRLKSLFDGNKFMEFIAEEYLQSVAENGSARLLSLSSGRYFLRYDGGFLVGDNLNGGALRGVNTLSGGETFLVSLSLALALSGEICLKSLRPIEFFFLDEGFGTLDERLVDTVMDSLEKLKGAHFSIGIISHVEELKHRIERKITVEKANEQHGSRIRI